MENLWGRLREPQRVSLPTCSGSSSPLTKSAVRQKVWEFLERNDIANFPRPVYNRIPNFKGASAAGAKVSLLPEFVSARTVKVNPDKPQEEVRFWVLSSGKTLIVPTPRLTQGLFNRLEADPKDASKERLRKLASRHGIDLLSKPVPMASRLKLDLVVVGAVAVDSLGHRIGKGEGFADLEFSMAASHHNAVNGDTVVVSTVHDCQVFDSLPEEMFRPHDLPVDIIVTPTRVIRVEKRLKKPDAINWDLITDEKFREISVLKELKFRERKAAKAQNGSSNGEGTERKRNNGNELAVFVGRIPRNAKSEDLKDAVLERGLNPSFVAWKAKKGFAFVYLDAKANGVTSQREVLDKLQDLKIGDTILNVEQNRRRNNAG